MSTKSIDDALGVESQEQELLPRKPSTPVIKKGEEDVYTDYEYQRQNFYNLIERGSYAI